MTIKKWYWVSRIMFNQSVTFCYLINRPAHVQLLIDWIFFLLTMRLSWVKHIFSSTYLLILLLKSVDICVMIMMMKVFWIKARRFMRCKLMSERQDTQKHVKNEEVNILACSMRRLKSAYFYLIFWRRENFISETTLMNLLEIPPNLFEIYSRFYRIC